VLRAASGGEILLPVRVSSLDVVVIPTAMSPLFVQVKGRKGAMEPGMANRAAVRALQAAAMAVGAPFGWLLIRTAGGAAPLAELAAHPGLYTYMLLGTAVVFGLFGFVLGQREDRMAGINAELETLSVTDALTGVRNARYFHTRLAEELARSRRSGEPLGLAVFDLDHFKRVNDEYGHLAGDDVLIAVARALASVTRQGETSARVGGEEFALLLPGSDVYAAYDAAERVRTAIEATRTPVAGKRLRITVSAGVASTAALPHATSVQLYRAADDALYAAKRAGRNRTVQAGSDEARYHAESYSV
jgi:diguanylate cyclase (GGDEF)-like protein